MKHKEAELGARVCDLEKAILQWDQAAEASSSKAVASAVASCAAPHAVDDPIPATADHRVLAALPEMPPIEDQLEELGVLASLCAEQIDAASRQVLDSLNAAEVERQRLAKAAHASTFRGYLDVDAPKVLLRSLIAA